MKTKEIVWRKSLNFPNLMEGWIDFHSTSFVICEIIDYLSYKKLVFKKPLFVDDRYSYEVKDLTKLAKKYWCDFLMTMIGKGKNGYFKTGDLTPLEKEEGT